MVAASATCDMIACRCQSACSIPQIPLMLDDYLASGPSEIFESFGTGRLWLLAGLHQGQGFAQGLETVSVSRVFWQHTTGSMVWVICVGSRWWQSFLQVPSSPTKILAVALQPHLHGQRRAKCLRASIDFLSNPGHANFQPLVDLRLKPHKCSSVKNYGSCKVQKPNTNY